MTKKKTEIKINSGMGFFRWLYLGIVLMRIAGVIDWPLEVIFLPPIIIAIIAFLVLLGRTDNEEDYE